MYNNNPDHGPGLRLRDENYEHDGKEMHQYRLDVIHFEQTTMDA